MTSPFPQIKQSSCHFPGMRLVCPTNWATKGLAGFENISFGVPICCTTPSFMMTILSAIPIASDWSWVTYKMLLCVSLWIRLISLRISIFSFASRLDRGSSIRRSPGLSASGRPKAPRGSVQPDGPSLPDKAFPWHALPCLSLSRS